MATFIDALIPVVVAASTALGAALIGAGMVISRATAESSARRREAQALSNALQALDPGLARLRSDTAAIHAGVAGLSEQQPERLIEGALKRATETEQTRTIEALMLTARLAIAERQRADAGRHGYGAEGADRG